jgi:hypothetical protein
MLKVKPLTSAHTFGDITVAVTVKPELAVTLERVNVPCAIET